jgi:dTDP-4-dehydrorhamnose 3,5-epimerase
MKFTETLIKGVFIIEPTIWQDQRGYFYESYNQKLFKEAGIDVDFVQDNQSLSQKGALRGLHAQAPPNAQGKLVRVIQGSVLDVAVDIRKNSPTYGKHITVHLTGDNFKMFWLPAGLLHGFLTLSDNTIFCYKVTNLYDQNAELGVSWNDPELNIDWGLQSDKIILSEKDKMQSSLKDFISPF